MSKVTLITEVESEDKFSFPIGETAEAVIAAVLEREHCPYDVEVSLTLVTDEAIRDMNRQFRDIDRETDVLSFPNLTFDTPSDFSFVDEDPADCLDPETGNLVLGDIVINTKRVRSQAAEYGHSEKREFAFLVAHSTLHLCGYDHMTEEEAGVMEARQEAALQSLGITREV
ncbi:MAG: rRNA maturation RNase YbeY [Lachnospiraceae bacterium]|jgi:probable rRNA maturation factor|nr:rRNA maturation RNase YbeY [Lachnospiraceae bacterium]MCI1398093.1 rRNA maturation RNase YbeY [Lachnospiraceae bacterium]MCI1423164.1 rRNA maturation RNase YbeY [Lachnospiraceae bacterium]MCI1452011.1 rRNA maturation RNase YbeY [Lachnospiraceae bacterium]MDD5848386.1 rRNA maturation RNase YbeY [Bacillota bacterium]